jgi:hypothetical protein
MTAYNSDVHTNTPPSRGDYEAAHMSPVTPAEDFRSVLINRIAWGPVFAGVVLALVVQLILNLTGLGIGVATLAPDTTSNWAVANLSLGTALWWTVIGIISAYAGGYVAGRLSGDPVESSAGWHGVTSWAASVLILSALIMGGSGAIIGGMLNTANFTGVPNPSLTAQQGTATQAAPAAAAAPAPTGTASGVQVPVATSAMTDNATLSKIITQGALLTAIALVFGGLAAWFGGRAGTIKPTITDKRKMNLH